MYKVLDLLEGQGRTDSASSWGLHTFKVIRLVSKEYVYVVHNASLNTVEFWWGYHPSRHNGSIYWQWISTLMLNLTEEMVMVMVWWPVTQTGILQLWRWRSSALVIPAMFVYNLEVCPLFCPSSIFSSASWCLFSFSFCQQHSVCLLWHEQHCFCLFWQSWEIFNFKICSKFGNFFGLAWFCKERRGEVCLTLRG